MTTMTTEPSTPSNDQLVEDLAKVRRELDMLRRATDELRHSASRYHDLFEQSPVGIREEDFAAAKVMIDQWRDGGVRDFRRFFEADDSALLAVVKAIRILDINQAAIDIYGLASRDEFLAADPDPTVLPGWRAAYGAVLVAFADGENRLASEHGAVGEGAPAGGVIASERKQLVVRSISHLGEPYRETWSRVVTSVEDITERWTADQDIAHRAHHDALTDLPNRNLFQDRLRQAMTQSDRYGRYFALHYVDLDHFKQVNDQHGHHIGDELLRAVAAGITRNTRTADTVARLGGDEFAVIQCELQEADNAGDLAGRFLKTLSKPYLLDGNEIRISATIGIALYPGDASDAAALQRNADLALYAGKAKGRNVFTLFDAGMIAIPTG